MYHYIEFQVVGKGVYFYFRAPNLISWHPFTIVIEVQFLIYEFLVNVWIIFDLLNCIVPKSFVHELMAM